MKAKEELNRLMTESRVARREALNYLLTKEETMNPESWITLEEYALRFDLGNAGDVQELIRRGIIPEEDLRDAPGQRGSQLIRAVRR